ncbi:MAG: GlmU family protein [Bacteroidetes bacterium]|nr:GlmU family protein [Bacteroidota bacterium]
MNYILFGDQTRTHLLPFTFTRPVADLRIGILTIREKWEKFLNTKTSSLTEKYLSEKFPLVKEADNILINGTFLPDNTIIEEIAKLKPNQTLVYGDVIIALRLMSEHIENIDLDLLEGITPLETKSEAFKVSHLWDLVSMNEKALRADFELITKGRKSADAGAYAKIVCKENVFIEEGAILENVIINASEGPVYIAKNAHIMDGAVIRGPVAIGEGSVIRINAKIYGGTTIGPHCKVGGEVSSSIIFGYSNKAHDGFLGHSVIGEWCNLGADTNTSNLKNSYEKVKLWDYAVNSFVDTGMQFCGTFMGDYSKSGINTMFNTGSVIGINAQVYGTGFIRNFIPSFTWGSPSNYSTFDVEKAIDVAKRVCSRRNIEFTKIDENIFRKVFEHTYSYRRF